jgi:hypothetical protein
MGRYRWVKADSLKDGCMNDLNIIFHMIAAHWVLALAFLGS